MLKGTAQEPLLRGYFRQLPLAVKPLDRLTAKKALIPAVRLVFRYLALRQLNSAPVHSRISLSPQPQSHEPNADPKPISSTHFTFTSLLLGDTEPSQVSLVPLGVEAA